MKIVYAGPLDEGGTCLSRYNALTNIEEKVEPFNTLAYLGRASRWQRLCEVLISSSRRFRQANEALLKLCASVEAGVLWVDKGFWIWPSTLKMLRRRGVFLVQHHTDALWPLRSNFWLKQRSLRSTLALYDLYFTTNLYDYEAIKRQGIVRTELTSLGYDPERFNNQPSHREIDAQLATKLLFVGHHELRTEAGMVALAKAGLPLTVYGSGWHKATHKRQLEGAIKCRQLNNEEYIHSLKQATIGLCFVSEINRNQTAARSFEIPASGTFLLAMRTPQHSECYVEGKEAEFFDGPEELVRKARFHLENDGRRREIARQGHERCVRSDYSWNRFMRDDWAKVLKVLSPHRSRQMQTNL